MTNHSGHNHEHGHVAGNIKVAFFLNLGFTVVEIIGGLWTNSVAILADAIHDLGDSLALGSAWYLERKSLKAGDRYYSYGYRRFSLLGALVSAVVLVGGSLLVLAEAIPRILQPEHANAQGMVVFAIVGIGVNGIAALRMKDQKGFNARVVTWHLLEDVLGWLAILIVSIILLFKDIHILDPVLSVLITVYILRNVIVSFKQVMNIFLQGTPEGIDILQLERAIEKIRGIIAVHHTHLWSLDGMSHIFSTHAVVSPEISREDMLYIKNAIRGILRHYEIEHSTVEFEYSDEICPIDSGFCRPTQGGARHADGKGSIIH